MNFLEGNYRGVNIFPRISKAPRFGARVVVLKSGGKSDAVALAAQRKGHQVQVINCNQVNLLGIEKEGESSLYINNQKLERPDIAISRIASLRKDSGKIAAVVRHIEGLAKVVVNKIEAIQGASDKFRTHQLLAKNRIPTPVTFQLDNTSGDGLDKLLAHVLKQLRGAFVILKTNRGSMGNGVFKVRKNKAAVKEALRKFPPKKPFMVQEFLHTAGDNPTDVRALVIGGKIAATMQRTAAPGKFKANLHQGGEGRRYRLSAEEKELVLKTARVTGLDINGVDLMNTVEKGPVIIEVNSNPGLQIRKKTRVNIPNYIVAHAEEKLEAFERDLKQGQFKSKKRKRSDSASPSR